MCNLSVASSPNPHGKRSRLKHSRSTRDTLQSPFIGGVEPSFLAVRWSRGFRRLRLPQCDRLEPSPIACRVPDGKPHPLLVSGIECGEFGRGEHWPSPNGYMTPACSCNVTSSSTAVWMPLSNCACSLRVELALPSRDHNGGYSIADDVGDGTHLREEPVDAEKKGNTGYGHRP